MKNWPDVISKFIDFLKQPSGLGVFVILILAGLIFHLFPLWLVGERLDNTMRETSQQQIRALDQIVSILKENKMAIGE